MTFKKFKLYATASTWNTKHSSLMSYLGIPNSGAQSYAIAEKVENSESPDFGKFIMPVVSGGIWDCADQFSSGVVEWQVTWYPDAPP